MLSNSLRCHSCGDPHKPYLVLLHGFLGCRHDFDGVIEALEPHFCILLVDLPGHGHSTLTDFPQDDAFKYVHQSLLRTLQQWEIKQYHLLGYSLGGRLALYHASQQPQGLLSLTLEACHPGLVDEADKVQRIDADQCWAIRFARQPLLDVLNDWYRQPVFGSLDDTMREAMIMKRCVHNQGIALAQVLDGLSLARQPSLWPYLMQPKVPTHYFAPSKDAKFHALGQRIVQQCPQVRVTTFNDAGHNIHWESPLQWSQHLIELIQEANYAG